MTQKERQPWKVFVGCERLASEFPKTAFQDGHYAGEYDKCETLCRENYFGGSNDIVVLATMRSAIRMHVSTTASNFDVVIS